MAIFRLYSKQQAVAKNRQSKYRHDEIPQPLRTQILTIFDKCLGKDGLARKTINRRIQEILEHEYGVQALIPFDTENLINYLWKEPVKDFFITALR